MQAQNAIRLPGGEELVLSEWLHQPLFSTIEFGAADPVNLYAFNYVKGQRVSHSVGVAPRQANESDTNVVKRKGMAQDEAMVVFSCTFEHFAINPQAPTALAQPVLSSDNLKRLQRSTVVALTVGAGIKKPQLGIPFEFLGQSIGTEAFVSGVANTTNYGTAGRLYAENQRLLKLPTYIGGYGDTQTAGNSMKFEWRFYAPNGAIPGLDQSVRLRFVLDGLKKRPV